MCYGKEIFRGKYKETMDSLNIIKDNYYDLDQEYQCSMKEKDKEIERLKTELQDTKEHLGEYLHEQEEENKRLNNIINELENYLDNLRWFRLGKKEENCNMEYFYANVNNFYEDTKNILKGSDKE